VLVLLLYACVRELRDLRTQPLPRLQRVQTQNGLAREGSALRAVQGPDREALLQEVRQVLLLLVRLTHPLGGHRGRAQLSPLRQERSPKGVLQAPIEFRAWTASGSAQEHRRRLFLIICGFAKGEEFFLLCPEEFRNHPGREGGQPVGQTEQQLEELVLQPQHCFLRQPTIRRGRAVPRGQPIQAQPTQKLPLFKAKEGGATGG